MRQSWFGSVSLEASSLAAALLALLLTTSHASAQSRSRSDADLDDSNASSNDNADRDNPDAAPRSSVQSNRNQVSRNAQSARSSRSARATSSARQGSHATLGVTFYNDDANPLEIRRVMPDSPADDAGLERGDEILSVNGRRVSSVQQLKQRLDRVGQEQEIELGILRDGRQDTVQATLSSNRRARASAGQGRSPRQGNRNQWHDDEGYAQGGNRNQWYGDEGYAQGGNRSQWYGNENYRQAYGNQGRGYGHRDDDYLEEGDDDRPFLGIMLDEYSRNGVRVTDIYPESPAEEAGLRPGDEIVAIDDEDVESSRDLKRLLSQRDPDDDVTIEVERNGRERTLRATLTSQQEFSSHYNPDSYRTGRRETYGRPGYDGGYNDQDYDDNQRSRRRQDRDQEDDD